jgi:hypothetical protein
MSTQHSNRGLPQDNDRGIFLIVMLILYALLYLVRLISIVLPSKFGGVYVGGPLLSYVLNICIVLLGAGGVIGIILRRRWGVYALILATIVAVGFDAIYISQKATVVNHILTVVALALLIWAVLRKWKGFG